jgi:hypothetical protein
MSLTSQIGSFGIAKQTAFGTPNSTAGDLIWFPTLRIPQFATRNTDELPKEISGVRGSQGSYVVNVATDGVVEALGRGKSLIYLLHSLLGSGASAALSGGVSQWTFVETEDYNWLTAVKQVGDKYAERYQDILVDGLTLTANNGGPARFAWDMIGTKATYQDPATYASHSKVDTQAPLQVVGELAEVGFGAYTGMAAACRSVEARISNGSTRDEFVIGDIHRQDVTKLDMVLEMTCEVFVNSEDEYLDLLYGSSAPAPGSEMTPTLQEETDFYLQIQGANVIGSTVYHNLLKINFEEVQLVTFPIELVGNNMLVATMMVRAHLPVSGSGSPVTATLVCANV